MRELLYLVKSGIPWDIAISLDAIELTAFLITLAELDGKPYDWENMRFKMT